MGRAAGGWEVGDGDERRPGKAVQTGRRQCRSGAGASVEGRGLRLCRTCTDPGQPAQMAEDENMYDYAAEAGFFNPAGDGAQPPDTWEQRDDGQQAGEQAHCPVPQTILGSCPRHIDIDRVQSWWFALTAYALPRPAPHPLAPSSAGVEEQAAPGVPQQGPHTLWPATPSRSPTYTPLQLPGTPCAGAAGGGDGQQQPAAGAAAAAGSAVHPHQAPPPPPSSSAT